MSGKGSGRRKENTSKVTDNLSKIDWTKKIKRNTFKTTVNGKVVGVKDDR
jgi:hypothetical protein